MTQIICTICAVFYQDTYFCSVIPKKVLPNTWVQIYSCYTCRPDKKIMVSRGRGEACIHRHLESPLHSMLRPARHLSCDRRPLRAEACLRGGRRVHIPQAKMSVCGLRSFDPSRPLETYYTKYSVGSSLAALRQGAKKCRQPTSSPARGGVSTGRGRER